MNYRRETVRTTQAEKVRKLHYWKRACIWIAGFPGYLLFFVGWISVLTTLVYKVGQTFIVNRGTSSINLPLQTRAGGTSINPVAGTLLTLLATTALFIVYWAISTYTARLITWLSYILGTSVWTVKIIGLALGLAMGAICVMLLQPQIGLVSPVIGLILIFIGIFSFGMEYACLRAWRTNKKRVDIHALDT